MFASGQLLICSSTVTNDKPRSRVASVLRCAQDIVADLFSSASFWALVKGGLPQREKYYKSALLDNLSQKPLKNSSNALISKSEERPISGHGCHLFLFIPVKTSSPWCWVSITGLLQDLHHVWLGFIQTTRKDMWFTRHGNKGWSVGKLLLMFCWKLRREN